MKKKIIILFLCLLITNIQSLNAEEKFLSLKKNKVNVRYGPSFESEIKYIYEKINLPVKQIDQKENFRRIVDLKIIVDGFMFLKLKNLIQSLSWKTKFYLKKHHIFLNLSLV